MTQSSSLFVRVAALTVFFVIAQLGPTQLARSAQSTQPAEDWTAVPLKLATRTLIAQARQQRKGKTFVSFEDVMRWDDGRRTRNRRSFIGHPCSGRSKVERFATAGWINRVEILDDGRFYQVERYAQSGAWRSMERHAVSKLLVGLGVANAASTPLPAERDGWTWSLTQFPMVDARSRGDELRVQFAASEAVSRTLKSKERIDFLSGGIGYEVLLRQIEGVYAVVQVDFLQRASTPAEVDGARVLKWKESTRLVPELGRRDLMGIECGSWLRYEFSGHRLFGPKLVFPTRVRQIVFDGDSATAEIDMDSVVVGAAPEAAFAFKPPPDFGSRGVHKRE